MDFADQGGAPSFVFNNLQPAQAASGSSCGGCSSSFSQGGGCSWFGSASITKPRRLWSVGFLLVKITYVA